MLVVCGLLVCVVRICLLVARGSLCCACLIFVVRFALCVVVADWLLHSVVCDLLCVMVCFLCAVVWVC